jgi:hypothetical protein
MTPIQRIYTNSIGSKIQVIRGQIFFSLLKGVWFKIPYREFTLLMKPPGPASGHSGRLWRRFHHFSTPEYLEAYNLATKLWRLSVECD